MSGTTGCFSTPGSRPGRLLPGCDTAAAVASHLSVSKRGGQKRGDSRVSDVNPGEDLVEVLRR